MDREVWQATVHGVTKESDVTEATVQQKQHILSWTESGLSFVCVYLYYVYIYVCVCVCRERNLVNFEKKHLYV